jgi:uncharacterized protein YjbI with pentapeptide repeats
MMWRRKAEWQSLPTGPWSPEQMFETMRLVGILRSEGVVTRSWTTQVLAEQLQRVSSAQASRQISLADANRYIATLIGELTELQRTRPRLFGRNSQLIFRGISFDDLLLQDTRLSDVYFSSCTFKGSNLGRSQFAACNFSECSFDQADMRRSTFIKCSLGACLFRGALLDRVWFHRSSVVGCDFENASTSFARGIPTREG